MPAERRQGMDHEHHEWSPISTRGKLSWPDYPRFSHRDYGHRVGIFRVLDVLENQGIKATVAMDTQTAEYYPYLVKHCLDRGCEIIAHGVSGSQMISGQMSVESETIFIRSSIEIMEKATGSKPRGWSGTDYGESERTPDLLCQAGLDYVCDWVNDEQPYPMRDGLSALPTMLEMDDLFAMSTRRVRIDRFAQSLKEGFDSMYEEGASNGRLMTIDLHPWLIGQPFRIGYLENAMKHVMGHDGVWAATGSEIVDWFRSNPPV